MIAVTGNHSLDVSAFNVGANCIRPIRIWGDRKGCPTAMIAVANNTTLSAGLQTILTGLQARIGRDINTLRQNHFLI
jgi:hypothetical protein